ncbi:histone-lysine N-methyltransferase SETD3, partial [Trifolium medium]|nr:histone-lysine N-methyltransferase SETD3 [Trifolium medium]
RRRGLCSASNSDTLVAAAGKKRNEDDNDLKTWMHKNGLSPCKVVLKDKPSHDDSHKPIHFVAASEDLQ